MVFINPGKSDEAYWVAAADAMQRAADSLGMQLQVIYAQRDRLAPIHIATQLAQRPQAQRPRYVIFTNDYSVAPGILRALDGSGIQAFMAFSGIQEELRQQVGLPRERYAFWLGSLEPRAEDAGYLTAKALIDTALKQLPQGVPLQMVAIAGDRSTPSSIARNEGMQKAVAQTQGRVQLMQEVYGEWRQDKAREQAQVLFKRYPAARLVWSGNDLMAFGAMEAWRNQGGRPGKDAFFSGVNTSSTAFQKLRSGELSALAGGHFLAGAWSLVMLFDHFKGRDFASEGVELERPMFKLFTAASSAQFERIWGAEPKPVNFKPFSKHHNPQLRHYDFDVERLLQHAD
ncbi:MAG: ABC transporter substrate-binding protein [Comamonas sp.]